MSYISDYGCFEVQDVTWLPSTVALGENASCTIQIKNISGKKITKLYLDFALSIPATHPSISTLVAYGMSGAVLQGSAKESADGEWSYNKKGITWNNNTTKSFTFTYPVQDPRQEGWSISAGYPMSSVMAYLHFETDIATGDGDKWDNVNNGGLAPIILPQRDSIEFSGSIERCDSSGKLDDEGESILTTIKATSASNASSHGYSVAVVCTPTVSDLSYTTLTSSDLFRGITNSRTKISGTFANETEQDVRIVLTNSQESYNCTFKVFRAFANMHLSGAEKGGVCFGGFSSSTDAAPLFECRYPAKFYNGIEDELNKEPRVLTLITDGKFQAYDFSLDLQMLIFGRVVMLRGVITPSKTIAGGTDQHVICKVPAAYAPPRVITSLQQGTGTAIWLMRVYPNDYEAIENNVTVDRSCQVTFSRYRNGDAYANASSGNWLPFHDTWIIG